MIYVIMHGRLGNQMFQYAFAKKIQEARSDDLIFYFGKVNNQGKERGWNDDLKHFNVEKYHVVDSLSFIFTKTSLKQKILLFTYLIKCKRIQDIDELMEYQCSMQNVLNEEGLYWLRNGKFSPGLAKTKNVFISGHFESNEFYIGMEKQLRKDFSPKRPILESNQKLMDVIQKTESVCISIRRGDFLSEDNKKTYYICDQKYIDKAVEVIKEKVKNPTLIFFSDDVEWIKKNCKYEGSVYFEAAGNPVWEKIRLMSACKHFIISNSTFSWWVQYLSENPKKIVISPSRWKKNSNYRGLISNNFFTIKV